MKLNSAPLREHLLPLMLGLLSGMLLVLNMGSLPVKWSVFFIGAVALFTGLLILRLFSTGTHLKLALLFLAIVSIPTFYDINFAFRENVRYASLANGFPISLSDIFFIPLAALWVYEIWTDPKHPPVKFNRSWLIPLLMLLILNLISALFVAKEPFFSWSMTYLMIKSYLIMLYLANNIRDERTFSLIIIASACALSFEGLVVLEQKFIGSIFTAENLGRAASLTSHMSGGDLTRPAGTLGHPNVLAMFLNLLLPIVIFATLWDKRPLIRLVLLAGIVLALIAEVWSGSRGGWLGLGTALGLGYFLWSRKRGKNPFIGLGIAGLVLLVSFATLFLSSETFQRRLVEGDKGAADVRYPLMEVAMEMIKANPVLGVGLDNYTQEMVLYDRTNLFIAYRYMHQVHNTFLMIAAETGIVSLVIFAVVFLMFIREAFRIYQQNDGLLAIVGIGLMGAFIAWYMHNQVNLTAPYGDTMLWVLVGMLAAAGRYTDERQPPPQPSPTTVSRAGRLT